MWKMVARQPITLTVGLCKSSLFHQSPALPTLFFPDGSRINGTSLETNQMCKKSLYLTRYQETNVRDRQPVHVDKAKLKPGINSIHDRIHRSNGDVLGGKLRDKIWRIEENVLEVSFKWQSSAHRLTRQDANSQSQPQPQVGCYGRLRSQT
jgi:hypothetical protein